VVIFGDGNPTTMAKRGALSPFLHKISLKILSRVLEID
jgi:hypothetical protein